MCWEGVHVHVFVLDLKIIMQVSDSCDLMSVAF